MILNAVSLADINFLTLRSNHSSEEARTGAILETSTTQRLNIVQTILILSPVLTSTPPNLDLASRLQLNNLPVVY